MDQVSSYRVPKEVVRVEIRVAGESPLRGEVYVASQAERHAGRERVLDLLNREERMFLPVHCADEPRLVNKRHLVEVLTLDERDRRLTLDAPGEHDEAPVRLCLGGGSSSAAAEPLVLEGRVIIEGPPERRRLLDYLNAAPRFFPLVGEQAVHLVNRAYVLHVIPES